MGSIVMRFWAVLSNKVQSVIFGVASVPFVCTSGSVAVIQKSFGPADLGIHLVSNENRTGNTLDAQEKKLKMVIDLVAQNSSGNLIFLKQQRIRTKCQTILQNATFHRQHPISITWHSVQVTILLQFCFLGKPYLVFHIKIIVEHVQHFSRRPTTRSWGKGSEFLGGVPRGGNFDHLHHLVSNGLLVIQKIQKKWHKRLQYEWI